MAECYVTIRDIQTRYNPYFHALKIKKLEEEAKEMYHLNTTISMYDYELGRIYSSAMSVEDTAISIIEKRERIEKMVDKSKKYIAIHDQVMKSLKRTSQLEVVLHIYQTRIRNLDEIGEIMGMTGEGIRKILDKYRQAVSDIILANELQDDTEAITEPEIQELSRLIDYNATYEPKKLPVTASPLHGLAKWFDDQRSKGGTKRESEHPQIL